MGIVRQKKDSKWDVVHFLVNELVNRVRVNIVAVDTLPIIVAGDILHFDVRFLSPAESACPLPVRKLTALGVTDARVAEVGTFEYVPVMAVGPIVTVPV